MEDVRKNFVLFCCFFNSRRPRGPVLGALLLLAAALSSCSGSADVEPKIVASAGGTVLLPCNITSTNDVPTVEWVKLPSDSMAFLYRDGFEIFEMKHSDFWYRTNLIMHELHHGNLSMLMSNVKLNDSGKYQCVIWRNNKKQVISTLELLVGAVSEPRLSVVPGVGGGLTLQCEARCWFPEPLITLIDNQGNEISAKEPKRNEASSGCFTVTRRVTLQTAANRVTCRVQQPDINQTRESEIYIPDECLRSCTAATATTFGVTILVVCFSAVVVFLVKKHYFSGGRTKPNLVNKDTHTGNPHKPKPSQVQQLRQSTDDPRSSPGTSKRVIPPPPKSLYHTHPPKPASSANSGPPQAGSLPQSNDSKPVVSAFMKRSSNGGSSAASTTDGAAPSIPPPDSKEKPLLRSASVYEIQPHAGRVRPLRRNTLSVMSHNRFSVLSDLSEDPEDAKPLIGNQVVTKAE